MPASEETLTCEHSPRVTRGSAVTNQSTAVQIPTTKYPNPQILGKGVYSLSLFFNLCPGLRHQSTKNLVWDTDLKSLRAPTKGSIFDTMILTIAVSWTCTHLYTQGDIFLQEVSSFYLWLLGVCELQPPCFYTSFSIASSLLVFFSVSPIDFYFWCFHNIFHDFP